MEGSESLSHTWKNKWALITGATSGIGKALAEDLAGVGARLVLTGRRLDRLQALAQALNAKHGTEAHVIQADLSDPNAPNLIWSFTQRQQIEVDVLVNNAGLLQHGEFVSSELKVELQMVQVHCLAVLHLTHLYLPSIVQRKTGHVLIVASTTLVPAPYLTTYAATKGFDLLFAEGLREEVAKHGVNVSALCAGPTESELHSNASSAPNEPNHMLQPAWQVAHRALAGLAAGKPRIHPSWLARLVSSLPRFLPRSTVSGGGERMYRPGRI